MCLFGKRAKEKIESFDVVTLRVMNMRSTREWEIEAKGDEAEISLYFIKFGQQEDVRELEKRAVCPVSQALGLLNGSGVLSWDGFFGKHPRGVLDGTMFDLKATVNGGKKISAHGSQNFPKGYREFTAGLYELIGID